MKPTTHWLWFSSRSDDPVPLEPSRYESTIYDGSPTPKPEWVCRAPNGGLHIDARIGRIDVHVSARPLPHLELNWTDPYCVRVVADSWLDSFRDLIDPERVFVGSLALAGSVLEGWSSFTHRPRQLSRRAT